ncbi:MAG: GTP-binding protein [Chloroflexi bacterium]|nr:GTP-binding protein [Chloroflexota bacterium]
MDLLRFSTAGSVDDGKSTLIGRLLYDSKQIFEDQLAAIERTSLRRGNGHVDLALLTDGLRAEREQGITIDVAYRYFATPRRKFIIADTPGHIQYTRNMVTGASTASLAVVLIDARRGVQEQSRRHAFLASLLGVPHLVVCINKMDLVDFREASYEEVKREFQAFAAGLSVRDVTYIPVSALHGDNVVDRSERMPWYDGPALLAFLEQVEVASHLDLTRQRFPVQLVIRPMSDEHHDYRAYAGRVDGGVFRVGDEVVVLPSGARSRVASIELLRQPVAEAYPPMSVTLTLDDDLDISRGDMIVGATAAPEPLQDVEALICWMTGRPLEEGSRYALKHTTRSVRAICDEVIYRHDVNTHDQHVDASSLGLNEIGRVRLRTTAPVFCDPYAVNRSTGSFILIDEATNDTVGAGMIVAAR